MASGSTGWRHKRFVDYAKHLPLPNKEWPEQVRLTTDGAARYHPDIDIESLERRCIDDGIELPQTRRPVRMFYWDARRVVGASDGYETTYVYVEWHTSGEFHGRPITLDLLQKKGL